MIKIYNLYFEYLNICFGIFYRNIFEEKQIEHNVPVEEIKAFWATMRNKKQNKDSKKYNPYTTLQIPSNAEIKMYLYRMISFLPNWKAAGLDRIYNYYIKKMANIHSHMYGIIKKICIEGKEEESWLYQDLTYLIPKGTPYKVGDFSLITSMQTLYKLTNKCFTKIIEPEMEERQLISENRLGIVRRTQEVNAVNKKYDIT